MWTASTVRNLFCKPASLQEALDLIQCISDSALLSRVYEQLEVRFEGAQSFVGIIRLLESSTRPLGARQPRRPPSILADLDSAAQSSGSCLALAESHLPLMSWRPSTSLTEGPRSDACSNSDHLDPPRSSHRQTGSIRQRPYPASKTSSHAPSYEDGSASLVARPTARTRSHTVPSYSQPSFAFFSPHPPLPSSHLTFPPQPASFDSNFAHHPSKFNSAPRSAPGSSFGKHAFRSSGWGGSHQVWEPVEDDRSRNDQSTWSSRESTIPPRTNFEVEGHTGYQQHYHQAQIQHHSIGSQYFQQHDRSSVEHLRESTTFESRHSQTSILPLSSYSLGRGDIDHPFPSSRASHLSSTGRCVMSSFFEPARHLDPYDDQRPTSSYPPSLDPSEDLSIYRGPRVQSGQHTRPTYLSDASYDPHLHLPTTHAHTFTSDREFSPCTGPRLVQAPASELPSTTPIVSAGPSVLSPVPHRFPSLEHSQLVSSYSSSTTTPSFSSTHSPLSTQSTSMLGLSLNPAGVSYHSALTEEVDLIEEQGIFEQRSCQDMDDDLGRSPGWR